MDANSLNEKCITVSLNHGLDFLTSSEFKMTGVLPNHTNLLTQPSASSQLLPSLFCNYNLVATGTNKNEIPTSAIYIQKCDTEGTRDGSNITENASYSLEASDKDRDIGTTTVQVQFKPTYPANTVNSSNGFQAVQSALAIKNEIDNINALNTEAESLQEHFEEEYQNYTCDFDNLRNDFNIEGTIADEAKLFKLESEEGFPLQVITQEFDTSECDAQSLQMMIKKEMYFESGLENGASDAILAGLQQSGLVSGNKAVYFQQDATKPKTRFECEYCHRTFSKLTCLRVHQRIHIDERPYKCDECGLSFSTDLNLKIHQKVHNGDNQYKCKLCGKCFGQLQNLKNHQKVHTAETPYKCEVCQEYFTTSAKLKVHRMIHSVESTLEYCAICNNVKRSGEQCETCNIVVTSISPVVPPSGSPSVVPHVVHQSINLNALPPSVSPNFAPQSTSPQIITPSVSPNDLTPSASPINIIPMVTSASNVNPTHLVKPPVVKKPFKCGECDKSFNNQEDLDFHELRHKDSKPFKCEFCGRGFSRKFNMQRHEKIHAGGAQV